VYGVVVGSILVACGYPDWEGSPLVGAATVQEGTLPQSEGDCEGPATLEKVDPSTLPPCCDGAHCLPTAKVPGKFRRSLATCAGGYCMPDGFLRGDTPGTCTAFGKEAACASKCLPEAAKNAALLQQDTCGAGELCAPCINPLTNEATGICEIGKPSAPGDCKGSGGNDASAGPPPKCPHEGPPVLDPLGLPSCGNMSGSHCMDTKLVSADMAKKLAPCDRGAGAGAARSGLCVPDVFITTGGQFIPPTCVSVGGAEGRCLHQSLPDVAKQKDSLPQSTCGGRESCVPCASPIDGADTGACKLSCDPGPTTPPYLFPTCCVQAGAPRGRCVPSDRVSVDEKARVTKDTCASSDLCVPSENLDDSFVPTKCAAFSAVYLGNYQGVCLSKCLKFSGLDALAIAKGSCDDLHQCVPCKKPGGEPTGAPGCVP